jgi:hypothetical protein
MVFGIAVVLLETGEVVRLPADAAARERQPPGHQVLSGCGGG